MQKRVAMTLTQNIAVELARRGWSRAKAAKQLGMTPNAFGPRMRGDREFRMVELVKLAGMLDIPVSRLVEGMEETKDYLDAARLGRRLRLAEEDELHDEGA